MCTTHCSTRGRSLTPPRASMRENSRDARRFSGAHASGSREGKATRARCGGVWCGHPPGATLPSHLDPGVNRAHFRGSCAGAFGGAPRPSRWSDHLADHNRLPDRLRSRCWGAPWPAACWPMPPLPEEEMGIRTSGTQSSPPHTASCGSLLWLRMVEAERWSRTIAENPPPSRSDRNDRERPRDGPGNRQTTYHPVTPREQRSIVTRHGGGCSARPASDPAGTNNVRACGYRQMSQNEAAPKNEPEFVAGAQSDECPARATPRPCMLSTRVRIDLLANMSLDEPK